MSTAYWMRAGRPKLEIESMAARQVRPEKSTSSTSMIVLPSRSTGSEVGCTGMRPRFARKSSRCIETSTVPAKIRTFSNDSIRLASRPREMHAAGRNPRQRDLGEVRVALNNFVGDAPETAIDRRPVEDQGSVRGGRSGYLFFSHVGLGDLAGSL